VGGLRDVRTIGEIRATSQKTRAFFHSQVNAAHLELTEWSQVAPVYITVFIICTAIIIIIVVVVVIFKLRV